MDNKIGIIFGIIAFYLIFGLIYLAIGNTLNDYGLDQPELEERDYSNNIIGEDTNGLLSFVVNGVSGYSESDNLTWINYFFAFLTAMLIFSIIITVLHG